MPGPEPLGWPKRRFPEGPNRRQMKKRRGRFYWLPPGLRAYSPGRTKSPFPFPNPPLVGTEAQFLVGLACPPDTGSDRPLFCRFVNGFFFFKNGSSQRSNGFPGSRVAGGWFRPALPPANGNAVPALLERIFPEPGPGSGIWSERDFAPAIPQTAASARRRRPQRPKPVFPQKAQAFFPAVPGTDEFQFSTNWSPNVRREGS